MNFFNRQLLLTVLGNIYANNYFVPLCLTTFAIRFVIGSLLVVFHSQFSLRYGKHVSAQRKFEINRFVELLVSQSEKVNNLNIAHLLMKCFVI